ICSRLTFNILDVAYLSEADELLLFLARRRPLTSPLFPYTTLFRSIPWTTATVKNIVWDVYKLAIYIAYGDDAPANVPQILTWDRSEEHTSELQSRFDLVCRLLLEKNKL